MDKENLAKSLTDLIDETLAEIEALEKGRLDAEEITLGHDANGKMAKEEDDKKDEKKEDKDDEKKEDKAEKAEDDDKEDDEEDKAEKAESKGSNEMVKAEMKMAKAKAKYDMRKAEYEMCKSKGAAPMAKSEAPAAPVVEDRISPLENKLAELTTLIKKMADAPVPARGVGYRDVQPLAKSEEAQAPLAKSQVTDALFELKKSGKNVTVEDMFKAETGGATELAAIANKYGIK